MFRSLQAIANLFSLAFLRPREITGYLQLPPGFVMPKRGVVSPNGYPVRVSRRKTKGKRDRSLRARANRRKATR